MAKVDDATTSVGSSSNWFKVDEMGLPSNNPDYWATEVLNVSLRSDALVQNLILHQDNCGHFTFTVPKDIAPGNYLIRAEVIGM